MNRKYKFILIAILFVLPTISKSFALEKKVSMEKLAIVALKEEKEWTRTHLVYAKPVNIEYIKNYTIFHVDVVDMVPSPTFYVAISEKKRYVFSPYWIDGTGKYSGLIKDENKEITEESVRQYLKTFLFLVNNNSLLIEQFEDIDFLDYYEKKLLLIYRDSIKPVEFIRRSERIEILFFSWAYGTIYKWKLSIKQNGEILSSKRKELNSKTTRGIY